VIAVRENMFGIEADFDYSICAGCGSLALVSIPEDLAAYYPTNYYSVDLDPERALGAPGIRQFAQMVTGSVLWGRGAVSGAATAVIPRRQLRTLVSVLHSIRRAGLVNGRATRVLDVGCGSGMLVFALGLAGMKDVAGIDPFLSGERDLSTGGRLRRQDLSQVEGHYDLIMFHHSFEHVPDPEAVLQGGAGTADAAGSGPDPDAHAIQPRFRDVWRRVGAARRAASPCGSLAAGVGPVVRAGWCRRRLGR